jgi:hypothetical protein
MTAASSSPSAPEEMRRPYAPPSHVIAVLKRARSRNLPDRITADFLGLAGIPPAMSARTAFTLKFLGLTEEDGSPAEMLRAIAAAGESEYRELLSKAIRSAYATDFERIDPSSDSQKAITDAFARYQPRSQTSRMVMTLLGLCREAEIPVLEAPRKRELLPTSRREERQTRPQSRTSQTSEQPRQETRATPQTAGTPIPQTAGTLIPQPEDAPLFAVSASDIAVLGDAEFVEVWTALGKVARARALARHAGNATAPSPSEEKPGEESSA